MPTPASPPRQTHTNGEPRGPPHWPPIYGVNLVSPTGWRSEAFFPSVTHARLLSYHCHIW
eukprot:scaffold316253_cov33-Prasinocladus_malaysianus.AAC.1